MKYATIPIANSSARVLKEATDHADGWWVQFGDVQLTYAAANKWQDVTKAVGRGGLSAEGDVKKGDMHLVVQKGRTFQQEHPDVRVILDKGRYLVVEISKSEAKSLIREGETCFGIEPLRENTVAFDQVIGEAAGARTGVAEIVAGLNQASYISDLTQLVGFPTRHSTSTHYQAAANWCEGRLSAMGYATQQTPVNVPGLGSSSNVIARKAGQHSAAQQVIVVAHLDSVNHPGGIGALAPGADDNASGSAGVLALAEALAASQTENDLTFILFGGEEQGLHGSEQFVMGMDATERARTKAVLNMDMIGHVNSVTQTVLLEGHPSSQSLITGLANAAAQFTTLAVQSSLNPFASDHVSFIDAGMPAVLTIEGADSANDAIHTGNDTLDRVDPAFSMEILKMNAAFLANEVGIVVAVTEQPSGCGCGDDGLTDQVRILALHYQLLLAQYARLGATGSLTQHDLVRMQALKTNHAHLTNQQHPS